MISEVHNVRNFITDELVMIGDYVVERAVLNQRDYIYDKVEQFRKDNLDFFNSKKLARPFINGTQSSDYLLGEKVDQHYINRLYFLYNTTALLADMKAEMFRSKDAYEKKVIDEQYAMAGEILPMLYEYHYMMQDWNICDKISILVDNTRRIVSKPDKTKVFSVSKDRLPFSTEVCEVMHKKYNDIMSEIENWQKKYNGHDQVVERNNILVKNMFSEKSPSDIYARHYRDEFEK